MVSSDTDGLRGAVVQGDFDVPRQGAIVEACDRADGAGHIRDSQCRRLDMLAHKCQRRAVPEDVPPVRHAWSRVIEQFALEQLDGAGDVLGHGVRVGRHGDVAGRVQDKIPGRPVQ
ncbi:hypothetical protein G6F60_015336 [Rhizopus arrhizus]|nr:hypothetical protein G6F60_015336 [Rhizopus arrhizus]